MTKKETRSGKAADLRKQAEEIARGDAQSPESLEAMSPEETRRKLHELRVHQIELEIQNEELHRAKTELEAAQSRDFDLYDLAPVGYVTVSKKGLILEANLTAAALLGAARGSLVKQPISRFILKNDQNVYYLLRKQLFETGEPQVCELRMVKSEGAPFWARLEATVAQGADGAPVYRAVMSDITERKRAEEALRASSELFSLFIRHSPIYTYIKEVTPTQSLVLQASDNFGQMIGIPGSEMVGKNMTELFPPELAAKITADDWAVVSGGNVLRLNEELNGRSYTTIKFPIVQGDKTFLAGYTIDITERKQAEEALQESEEKFRTIFENSSSAMAIIERDTTISMVNREYCKIGLFEEKDVIGKSWTTQIPPGDLERLKEYNRKRLIDPKSAPDQYEFTFYRKDGKIRHSLMSVAIIPTSKNIVASFIDITERKIAEEALQKAHDELEQRVADRTEKLRQANEELQTDITERKRIEAALLVSEGRFKKLFIEAPLGVALIDSLTGHIFEVNPMFAKIADRTMEEMMQIDWMSITHPDDVQEDLDNMALLNAGKTNGFQMEKRYLHHDGTAVWINMTIAKVEVENKAHPRHLCMIEDITDRKQAEADKEKLEAQNRQLQKAESLGRMAGAIAHTFNNQLGVVIGNLELALMDLPQGSKPVNSLTTAMRAANKAAAVSGQMLTYLGQSFDKREPLDLSDACRKSLPMFQAIMPGNVVLETDLPSPSPSIIANAIEIQQVLTNLITNAWEAVGAGRGSIHLRVKTVSPTEILTVHRHPIDWQPQDNAYACLEVTDTGCGITDNDIEKLFDPFFTSKLTGRGLGLPMVLGIVKAHSGSVTMESEPGRGSTFRVFLPASAAEVPRQPDPVVQPLTTERGGTILLVEDEEMVREMAAAMLNRLGFSVLEAKDGVEAVEVFRQRQDEIRLVLSDLTMPRMNGWETLTALRKLAPDIPVILASGYDKAHVMSGDHPELPQVFLGKPYRLKELSDAISQALVRRK